MVFVYNHTEDIAEEGGSWLRAHANSVSHGAEGGEATGGQWQRYNETLTNATPPTARQKGGLPPVTRYLSTAL